MRNAFLLRHTGKAHDEALQVRSFRQTEVEINAQVTPYQATNLSQGSGLSFL